ncbi:MAG: transposase [Gemmataceae bacterium]|nr:transposase [Gemmataceae bacterium]
MLVPAVRVVRCAPKTHPCPSCGQRGRRKRLLRRRIRSLGYRQVAYLDLHYAEYQARCGCCKSFRSWPLDVPPKSDYCPLVRQAVLDRLLDDGLNVERTRAALKRDFLLDLSIGFLHDCLDWELRRLDRPAHRRRTLERFSGTMCVDELHLGKHTLLLATDPLADQIVGFALVGANDQAHLRRFLLMLKSHGFLPEVVISDGSNLYPAVLAEVWPQAAHQLCVFHVLQDVTEKVLDAVRRLRRACERRGKAGRKRKRGRPKKGARKRAGSQGPTSKEKAAFVFKRRYLIVKRFESLSERERADLERMFGYLPELKVLWKFSQEIYQVWDTQQGRKVARWRWARLKNDPAYREVPELKEVLEWLNQEKFDKTLAFLKQPVEERQKTNNHVERTNRRLRFDEKVRYKWRRRKSIVRWVLLRISRHVPKPKARGKEPPQPRIGGS